MVRLAMLLFSLVGTAMAGSGVVIALLTGHDTVQGILWGAALGAVLAVPVSVAVARELTGEGDL